MWFIPCYIVHRSDDTKESISLRRVKRRGEGVHCDYRCQFKMLVSLCALCFTQRSSFCCFWLLNFFLISQKKNIESGLHTAAHEDSYTFPRHAAFGPHGVVRFAKYFCFFFIICFFRLNVYFNRWKEKERKYCPLLFFLFFFLLLLLFAVGVIAKARRG
uniref:WGS project CAEQ00000000 data, annotated contig 1625 n=1 Tax=Trypanosoma congolense (strain IL3000) TaxID=1068625 RepID=F9W7L2_TRYCI|nr:unnamed protein product [Trypanosoma congolense IL3000]